VDSLRDLLQLLPHFGQLVSQDGDFFGVLPVKLGDFELCSQIPLLERHGGIYGELMSIGMAIGNTAGSLPLVSGDETHEVSCESRLRTRSSARHLTICLSQLKEE